MKNKVKRLLAIFGFKSKKYIHCCFDRDAELYLKHSGLQGETPPVVAAKIRIICHTIEKALSLSNCRADFGRDKINELLRLYTMYNNAPDKDKDVLDVAESTVSTYIHHRQKHQLDISFISPSFLEDRSARVKCGAQQLSSSLDDFAHFPSISKARHSVRNFSNEEIRKEDIINAIKIAQTAPSACNRQATRIYAITAASKIDAIKQRHGGIRTFGQPGVIFVITQDINLYINEYERNTWLVDGGIFCMNLLYSLNSFGIANCPVIWGGMDDEDKFISELIGIPENERVVILVVGGYPEDNVKTPCSGKRPLEDIVRFIN